MIGDDMKLWFIVIFFKLFGLVWIVVQARTILEVGWDKITLCTTDCLATDIAELQIWGIITSSGYPSITVGNAFVMKNTFMSQLVIRIIEIPPGSVVPAATISPCPPSLVWFKGLSCTYPEWLPFLGFSRNEIISLLVSDRGKMAAITFALFLCCHPSQNILAEEVALASLLLPSVFTFWDTLVFTVQCVSWKTICLVKLRGAKN